MKYIIVLADGMADLPIKSLNNKTPMEASNTPNIDKLSLYSKQGLVKSIPNGMEPGSDVANLSIMGYDPSIYYCGRSSIEAASIGVELGINDLALRTNFVTLDYMGTYIDSVIIDHGSDEITSVEAYELLDAIISNFTSERIHFYKGTSYRHLLLLSDTKNTFELTPPHNILNKRIANYLPKGKNSDLLYKMMEQSYMILSDHEINKKRIQKGLNPANSIWIWGAGTKLSVPDFNEKYHLKGGVISAVDLIKGLGHISGMRVIDVPGATGTLNTNYKGKLNACIDALKSGLDLIYLHIEAPDECGHKGDLNNKIRAIELIDEKIVGGLINASDEIGQFKLIVLPDHPTPISLRTHTSDPVPFLIYDSTKPFKGVSGFSEKTASNTGIYIDKGHDLIEYFLDR